MAGPMVMAAHGQVLRTQRPYRWDCGKEFRALAKAAHVENIRIHDLRHAGATTLMTLASRIRLFARSPHRSRELERYQHLAPELLALTVNLIAGELFRAKGGRKAGARRANGTPTGTVSDLNAVLLRDQIRSQVVRERLGLGAASDWNAKNRTAWCATGREIRPPVSREYCATRARQTRGRSHRPAGPSDPVSLRTPRCCSPTVPM
jgi:hypothetical protein